MTVLIRLLAVWVLVLAPSHPSVAQDVLSYHPAFFEGEAVLLPEIAGAWEIDLFGQDTVSFQRAGDNFYLVRVHSEGPSPRYEGVFTRIGNSVLLDLLPILTDSIGSGDYRKQLLEVHSLFRVTVDKDALHLASPNYRWFYDNVIAKKSPVSHLWAGSRLLLTLSTDELRAFFAEHSRDSGFFENDFTVHRVAAQEGSHIAIGQSLTEGLQQDKDEKGAAPRQEGCMPSFPYKDGWLGGDGGLSVPIGPSKSLWLFGDTFVGKKDQTTRSGSSMVTTIGISTCQPDKTVDMQYYWRNMYTDHPDHFFQSHTDRYKYWPTDLFMHNHNLYVVMSKIGPKPGASPDDIFNWSAIGITIAKVTDPNATPPDQWKIDLFPWSHVLDANLYDGGFAEDGKYIYLFMLKEGRKNYLVRLPLDYIESPEGHIEYFSRDETWKPGSDSADAKILFDDRLIGRVLYHPESKRWLMAYGPHFGRKSVYFRAASEITGPWSDRHTLYECPELIEGTPLYDEDNFCYCARVHAQFFNEDSSKLLVTYTCGSKNWSKSIANMTIGVPQVLVIPVPR